MQVYFIIVWYNILIVFSGAILIVISVQKNNNFKFEMSQYSRSNDLDNLLYNSTSQYDEDEDLRKQLDSVQDKFLREQALDSEDDEEQGVQLGNGESLEGDRDWDDNEDGSAWNNQQQTKFYFREVAGNSEQFSQSLSIHKADFLQSKSMHDSSIIQNINLNNILNNKKKQEGAINQFIGKECQSFAKTMKEQDEKIKKQECLISGYVLKISKLEKIVEEQKNQNYELDQRNNEYLRKLGKKDELFKTLKEEYEKTVEKLKYQEELSESKTQKIQDLNNTLRAFTDSDRGLTDFRSSITPKRSKQSFRSTTPTRQRELDREIQKIRRQKTVIETQFQIIKEQLTRKQEKFKTIQDDLMKKITMKDKKIKELEEVLENGKEQAGKNKKNYESYVNQLKKKISKYERDLSMKDDKIRECEQDIKNSLDEREKNLAVIKDLRTQNQNKMKKIAELKRDLNEEQARNHIQSNLQKERENQIDNLREEVKELKCEKFNIKRQLDNLEKPSNVQQKLRKEIESIKKQNEKLKKDTKDLNEEVNNLEKQIEEKDEKIRELRKKSDEISKKNQLLSKKKSVSEQQKQHELSTNSKELQECKQLVAKLNKQNNELRKRAEKNQQMANKLYILESRMKFSQDDRDEEEQFNMEEELEYLRDELEQKQFEINDLKEAHLREIQRMTNENETLSKTLEDMQKNFQFKQKSLDFLHAKFVEIEKQNAELKVSKNILHSSFYDESYDQGDSQAIHFYENKIASLEKKIDHLMNSLREKEFQLERQSQKSDSTTSRFEVTQLKKRVNQLQDLLMRNEPSRKIAPESLSQQQTIDFLLKTLKKVSKSHQMLRSLSRIPEFRSVIFNLEKSIEKEMRGR